jgi:hypothetical protein
MPVADDPLWKEWLTGEKIFGYRIKDIQSEPVCVPSFLELSMP